MVMDSFWKCYHICVCRNYIIYFSSASTGSSGLVTGPGGWGRCCLWPYLAMGCGCTSLCPRKVLAMPMEAMPSSRLCLWHACCMPMGCLWHSSPYGGSVQCLSPVWKMESAVYWYISTAVALPLVGATLKNSNCSHSCGIGLKGKMA